ncbi:hypothetical protein BO86DRAFT_388343 [Aspergillus japonicus CBS 114.51]|uniref:Glycine-rich protein n=2 Tax=Aspergillus TaxID=5052 RepID=A0A2V5GZV5_ASPV1|nr:hypothetical protein BO86DRAFT_388343 [Aspergillus japonicus CBS 114.51]PYI17085.1 hypothetical protein BO99DRAFT_404526 [Aspergillus violaceofuscus CBS 115571]RAH83136.1 hypothetical protein BO86DRAFT_388343 [Aspergillus japonicus CBS 114.51]
MAPEPRTYVSGGRVLGSPPLTVRVSRFFESVYVFLGLYLVSFFSLDPYAAAQNSQFNIHRKGNPSGPTSRWGLFGGGGSGGPGGGGGGGGPGGGPRGFGPRKIGRVDDVRGPECKSCG